MSTKQLSIVIKAVDALTGPLRGMTNAVAGVGGAVGRVAASVTGSLTGVNSLIGAAVGLISGGLLIRSIDQTGQKLEELGAKARELELPIELLSSLNYAAKLNNQSFEEVAEQVATAERNIALFARTGGGKAAEALSRLRTPLRDSEGRLRNIADILPDLVGELNNFGGADARSLAEKIFGGDSARLLQLGLEDLRAITEEGQKLGAIFTPEQVEAAVKYRDALDRLGAAWDGLKAKIIAAVGGDVAAAVNRLAEVVSVIPQVAGKIVSQIRLAISDRGPVGQAVRDGIRELQLASAEFIKTAVAGLILVGYETAKFVLRATLSLLWNEIVDWVKIKAVQLDGLIADAVAASAEKIYDALKGVAPKFVTSALLGVKLAFEGISTAAQATESYLRVVTSSSAKASAVMLQMGSDGVDVAAAFEALGKSTDESGRKMLMAVDSLFGISDALASVSIGAGVATDKFRGADIEIKKFNEYGDFGDGIKQGLADIADQAAQVAGQARAMVNSIAGSISNELAGAFVVIIQGTESIGRAFKKVASSILAQISQMIFQMLIFKAIAGIASSFSSSAYPAPNNLGAPGPLLPNSGGMIGRDGLRRYGGGGFVGGPNVNRDIVPALLTPGEVVLNRAAVGLLGAGRLLAANRGDTSGFGGGVTVHQTVNIQGGGGSVDGRMLDSIRKASADGVLDALSRSPGFRDSMRRALA